MLNSYSLAPQTIWSQGTYRLEIISAISLIDKRPTTKGSGGRDYNSYGMGAYTNTKWQSIADGLQLLEHCICRTPDENIDAEHLWNQFHDCMQNLVYTHIPHKTARRRCNLPWMTTKLRRQIRTRNRLYQKAKLSGSKDVFNRFVTLKHSIQKDLRASYWRYINNLISPEDEGSQQQSQKRFWSYIKSLKHDHNNITALSTTDGIVTDDLQKANALNLQFKSVFTEERHGPFPNKGPSPHPVMPDINVTTSGIDAFLSNLKIHKATGPDRISARVLKEMHSSIAPILKVIFDCCLNTGVVPNDWKVANVTPLFKKGDRLQTSNYRPISLTSIISKIFEHILCSNIMKHLETNGILHHRQHGFRHNHSCETQLISLVHDLTNNYDAGTQTDLISMDFAKAFDTVPHQRLMYKLQWYGVHGKVHKWISEFLTNRSQKVVLNGTCSTSVKVTSGVPQGTVLGPSLFLIYINDLPECVNHSEIRLFADDCIVYRCIHNQQDAELLQEDINAIQTWTSTWQMNFNVSKCCSTHFTQAITYKMENTYYLYDTPLLSLDHFKYLGITLQSNLRYDRHIQDITAKANRTLGLLRRNIRTPTPQLKECAYKALVRPQLE